MTIEIIKHGNRIVKCETCESVLKYEDLDVRQRSTCDYRGEKYNVRFIRCPVCFSEAKLFG